MSLKVPRISLKPVWDRIVYIFATVRDSMQREVSTFSKRYQPFAQTHTRCAQAIVRRRKRKWREMQPKVYSQLPDLFYYLLRCRVLRASRHSDGSLLSSDVRLASWDTKPI
ncbi:hypothetical protein CBL_07066 [Carabus blaptoides fortunei]